jgi:hypothetical protein
MQQAKGDVYFALLLSFISFSHFYTSFFKKALVQRKKERE